MTIDDVLRDFAETRHVLPVESMRWALDNWEVAGPRFVDLLRRYADGEARDEATQSALFFVIHLLAEKRETSAFPALCKLLRSEEVAYLVLGDAVLENLRGILISTYDGDTAALKGIIEAQTADEFVRAAGLEAMAYLTRTGTFSDDEMRAYLLRLRAEMRPGEESFVWTAWVLAAANLGYQDYASEVEKMIRHRIIPYRDIVIEDFKRRLRRTLEDSDGMAGFAADRIEPFTDTIGTLSTWYGFSEEAARKAVLGGELPDEWDDDPVSWEYSDVPYVNPLRQVGRNDPCPCGSGKKYKKCCLQLE